MRVIPSATPNLCKSSVIDWTVRGSGVCSIKVLMVTWNVLPGMQFFAYPRLSSPWAIASRKSRLSAVR